MNNIHLSSQFDLALNSYAQGRSLLLTEYEKSIFLTQAQDVLIREYFNPTGMPNIDTSSVNEESLHKFIKTIEKFPKDSTYFPLDSQLLDIDDEVLYFLNEEAIDTTSTFVVIPLNHKQYSRLISRPYPYPNKREVWRLRTEEGFILIPPYGVHIQKYIARVVINPEPIILEDLTYDSRGLNIKGKTEYSECLLDDSIIPTLLKVAVQMVLESKGLTQAQQPDNQQQQ